MDSVGDRVSSIDKMSGDIGIKYQSVDHVYKGKSGQRSLSDMCIVEFSSNEDRERALQLANKKSWKDSAAGDLKIDRAKTKFQIHRNNFLRKAEETLRKQNENKNKRIEIIWKKDETGNKDREVLVDGIPAFRQKISDFQGDFLSPFSNLS